MRNLLIVAIFSVTIVLKSEGQTELSYYLPQNTDYDNTIPTPDEVIGHPIGEWHITHDKLVFYMKALARASDKVSMETYGYTHEDRPLLLMTISSEQNLTHLNTIKHKRKKLLNQYTEDTIAYQNTPLVTWMGYSIHGNEASGANAAPLVAYYLAAAQDPQVDSLLKNTIILIDPCINPDGLQRFSNWVNAHKSKNLVADPANLEYHEPWPRGRTNHYWFDLNRDWLLLQQPESIARIKKFHEWKPNILTDHHEMSKDATYFFQPGVTSRNHPLTPESTFNLTKKIATHHARALDKNKTLYFSGETFDDFYYGKGSTYPDINGGIGILFEQSSSRGHLRETVHGNLSFAETIRNQFITSKSTLEAALQYKEDLLKHQHTFYRSALQEAEEDEHKAYIFGHNNDRTKVYNLARTLQRHDITLYEPLKDITVNDKTFHAGKSYIIPMEQPQYRLIKSLFEKRTSFTDSIFYDVSTWSFDLAFDVDFEKLNTKNIDSDLIGKQVDSLKIPQGSVEWKSNYAYAIKWEAYKTPALLNKLLENDLLVKVTTKAFYDNNNNRFPPGTLVLPLGIQETSDNEIYDILVKWSDTYATNVYPLETGANPLGVDIGSPSIKMLNKPEILLITGEGVNAYEAGEIWHLLDYKMDIRITLSTPDVIKKNDLSQYNTIILPDGNYNELNQSANKIRDWLANGGLIIAQKGGLKWLDRTNIAGFDFKPISHDSLINISYANKDRSKAAQLIRGAIFNIHIDNTHPLFYSINDNQLAVFKNSKYILDQNINTIYTPAHFGKNPLHAGYVSSKNLELIKNTPAISIVPHGKGKVIGFTDNYNFRGFWYGTNTIFLNALFFGHVIDLK